jgi:hypothetical protein
MQIIPIYNTPEESTDLQGHLAKISAKRINFMHQGKGDSSEKHRIDKTSTQAFCHASITSACIILSPQPIV